MYKAYIYQSIFLFWSADLSLNSSGYLFWFMWHQFHMWAVRAESSSFCKVCGIVIICLKLSITSILHIYIYIELCYEYTIIRVRFTYFSFCYIIYYHFLERKNSRTYSVYHYKFIMLVHVWYLHCICMYSLRMQSMLCNWNYN